jgi:predicted Zn-ribbon and HTH transcriptional regulator
MLYYEVRVMGKVRIEALKCERCGHLWVPHKPIKEVRLCPHCKTAYWDKPKNAK